VVSARAGRASPKRATYQATRWRLFGLSPHPKEAFMPQTARQLVGAAKYTRYTLGSLSAVLFAVCAGGS
jgi:hypothetical protein